MFQTFYPDTYIESVYQVDFMNVWEQGIKGLIFDVDNTLTKHGEPATKEAIELMQTLSDIGFSVVFLSNNKELRVKSFFEKVKATAYIYKASKPRRGNYFKAMEIMGTDLNSTIFFGDQLFTDVWGAKRTGVFGVLVSPIDKKEEIQIVLKRKLEKIILYFYRRRLLKSNLSRPRFEIVSRKDC